MLGNVTGTIGPRDGVRMGDDLPLGRNVRVSVEDKVGNNEQGNAQEEERYARPCVQTTQPNHAQRYCF